MNTQDGSSETETDSSESSQQPDNQTPTNPPQTGQSIDVAKLLNDFKAEIVTPIQQQNQQLMRQNQQLARQLELAQQNTVAATDPLANVPDDPAEFHKSPKQHTKTIVREELKAMIDPLANELRADKQSSALDRSLDKYENHPKLGAFVKAHRDDLMTAMNGVPVDDGNLLAAIAQVRGAVEFNLIPSRMTAPTPTPTPNNQPPVSKELPASLNPSTPPTPKPPVNNGPKPLTETDVMAMKIGGWDPKNPAHVKEYRQFNESPSQNVSDWMDYGKADIPPK